MVIEYFTAVDLEVVLPLFTMGVMFGFGLSIVFGLVQKIFDFLRSLLLGVSNTKEGGFTK